MPEKPETNQRAFRLRVAVIDGQGGGVGKALVEKLRNTFGKEIYILALGTNSQASSLMLRAGADDAATGENPIVKNCSRVDVIMGPIGILAAESMLGELTSAMAHAVGASEALKILLPLNRCQLLVAGMRAVPFAVYIDEAVDLLRSRITEAGS